MCYEILETDQNAPMEDVKKAYKRLSLKYHPDRPGGSDSKFKTINEAYTILSSKNKVDEHEHEHEHEIENVMFYANVVSIGDMVNSMRDMLPRKGTDVSKTIQVSLSSMYMHRIQTFKLKSIGQSVKLDTIDAIRGVTITGFGNREPWANVSGDLRIRVKLKIDMDGFSLREDGTLEYTKHINMSDLLNGVKWILRLPDKSQIKIHHSFINKPMTRRVIHKKGFESGFESGFERKFERTNLSITYILTGPIL